MGHFGPSAGLMPDAFTKRHHIGCPSKLAVATLRSYPV